MRKTFYQILVLAFICTNAYAQFQTPTEKYWNYRKFFNDHFILRGFDTSTNKDIGGYGIPAVFTFDSNH